MQLIPGAPVRNMTRANAMMGWEKRNELFRGNVCAYLTGWLMTLFPSAATPARVYIFELKVLTNIVKKRTFAFTGLGKSGEEQARTDDAEHAFPDACRVDVGSGLMTSQSEHSNSADLERISS
jgi:hypothetical protein